MTNIKFKECNIEIAKNQKEYKSLHAFVDQTASITCYKLSFMDRIRALLFGKLWLGQLNFGNPLQPQLPSFKKSDLLTTKIKQND